MWSCVPCCPPPAQIRCSTRAGRERAARRLGNDTGIVTDGRLPSSYSTSVRRWEPGRRRGSAVPCRAAESFSALRGVVGEVGDAGVDDGVDGGGDEGVFAGAVTPGGQGSGVAGRTSDRVDAAGDQRAARAF